MPSSRGSSYPRIKLGSPVLQANSLWSELPWKPYTLTPFQLTLILQRQTNPQSEKSNDLLYSTGNSTQQSVIIYMGKESKKEWIFVSLIHFAAPPETNTMLKSSYTLIEDKNNQMIPKRSLVLFLCKIN